MTTTASQPSPPIGRPVRIVSLCFPIGSKGLEEVGRLVDSAGAEGCDLIVLPETWSGSDPEPLDGPTVAALASLARKHRTWIVCPMTRSDGPRCVNSAVLLNRAGEVAGVYDKVYPYWGEFDGPPSIETGHDAPVFQTDFGRLGMAICFDVNFPAVWQRLADQQADLVVWPSAYSAGSSLQAHAINHHYAIVTATATGDCQVYDITGQRILDECDRQLCISRITLDLDRGIYHENFNLDRLDTLLRDHAADVAQELYLPREQWFVLKALRPGVSAKSLAHEHGLEELRDYLQRSRRQIDEMRGANFAAFTAIADSGSPPA